MFSRGLELREEGLMKEDLDIIKKTKNWRLSDEGNRL